MVFSTKQDDHCKWTSGQVLNANTDHKSIVVNRLEVTETGKKIRLYPTQYKNRPSLRIELYGCTAIGNILVTYFKYMLLHLITDCSGLLGMKDGRIPDFSITASSTHAVGCQGCDPRYAPLPKYSRLDHPGSQYAKLTGQ